MNITMAALPNQISVPTMTEVARTQTEENKERTGVEDEFRKVRSEIKENREEIHQLRQKMDQKDSRLVRGIHWFAVFVFCCIGGYWIVEVITTYASEPLSATVNTIENKTFALPTISIQVHDNCYNMTAVQELKKTHQVILTPLKPSQPLKLFHIKDQNFDWSEHNVSMMYLETKYMPPKARLVLLCAYTSTTLDGANCRTTGPLGTWESYGTQYNVKEAFTPAPASSIKDNVLFIMNASLCGAATIVAFHPNTDKHYGPHPSALQFEVWRGQFVELRVALEEQHYISTLAAPCVDDHWYSQAGCYNEKIVEFKIRMAGCHFPGITGYQPNTWGYPECLNASAYHRFMHWHDEIYQHEARYGILQKMKNECGKPCHTKKYIITDKVTYEKGVYHRAGMAAIVIRLDARAMSYQSIIEARAITLDMLMADVGGIMGMFLGLSCVSAMEFVINRMTRKLARRLGHLNVAFRNVR